VPGDLKFWFRSVGRCPLTSQLISALLSSISFLLVVICWGVAHHRFSDNGLDPKYGSAFALVIVGWLLYLLAIPFVVIGWLRERHYRREVEAASTRRRWF
jgi:cell division protein FtsX